MPISNKFKSIHNKDFEINFMQCTPDGSFKITELCNMLQLTAAEHSELGGISFIDMQIYNQAWVLSRMRLEIAALPKWKDTVTIKTWICSLENSRSIRALEVYVNKNKMIGSETFWAVFNTKTRRPEILQLPQDHFEKFVNNRGTVVEINKIKIPENLQFIQRKKVYLSDVDMVNHVNNVKYLEWCLDLIDENLILNNQIVSIEMNFLKELSLFDEVDIEKINTEKNIYFKIKKDLKSVFLLQINLL